MHRNPLKILSVYKNKITSWLVLLLVVAGFTASAQIGGPPANGAGEIVLLKRADKLEGAQSGTDEIRKLIGNVHLQQKGVLMFCDLAIQNLTTNVIEAYGNVRLVQGDTINVRGDTMLYYGATRQANLTGRSVVLKDRKMTLTTRRLDYDLVTGIAHYPVPGRIVDRENVLTSREGYYDTRTKQFTFRENVRLVNPKYTLAADSLLYNSLSRIATFQGPTRITSKDGTLIARNGDYNTVTRLSNFQRRATIETEKYTLTGDTLYGNNANDFYTARGNVILFAKTDKTILTGDFGRYNRKAGVSRMTGNAVVKSIVSADTLFMRADTLWSYELPNLTKPKAKSTGKPDESSTHRRLIGHKNVLVYKSDLQSKCDSIVYETADSTIFFFHDPIVWSTNYQMEADSITAKMKNNRIHTMFLRSRSFVISQDTLLNFNQVKGRTVTAYFGYDAKLDRSDIDHVVVEGNGESIYFAVDEKNKLVGMNRVLCSKMNIRFMDRKVKKISFYGQPDSKLIPPQELKGPEKQLEGFKWRQDERPTKARTLNLRDSVRAKPATLVSDAAKKPIETAALKAMKNPTVKAAVDTVIQKSKSIPTVVNAVRAGVPDSTLTTPMKQKVVEKAVQRSSTTVLQESDLEKTLNRKSGKKNQ